MEVLTNQLHQCSVVALVVVEKQDFVVVHTRSFLQRVRDLDRCVRNGVVQQVRWFVLLVDEGVVVQVVLDDHDWDLREELKTHEVQRENLFP